MKHTRARTLLHMQQLLALAAVGCAHDQNAASANAVTLPEPDASAPASSSSASHLVLQQHPPPPDDDDEQQQHMRLPMHGSDPMPPPSTCRQLDHPTATASLVQDAAGVVVEIHVTLPANHPSQATFFPPAKIQAPGKQPRVWGGSVVSATITKDTAVVRILPNGAQQNAVTADFELQCANQDSGALQVHATFTTARAGAAVTVNALVH